MKKICLTLFVAISMLTAMLAVYHVDLIGRGLNEMYGPDGLQDSARQYSQLVEEGHDKLNKKDYREAKRIFSQALNVCRRKFTAVRYSPGYIGNENLALDGLAASIAGQELLPQPIKNE